MECPYCEETAPFPKTINTTHCGSCYTLLTDEDREGDND